MYFILLYIYVFYYIYMYVIIYIYVVNVVRDTDNSPMDLFFPFKQINSNLQAVPSLKGMLCGRSSMRRSGRQ